MTGNSNTVVLLAVLLVGLLAACANADGPCCGGWGFPKCREGGCDWCNGVGKCNFYCCNCDDGCKGETLMDDALENRRGEVFDELDENGDSVIDEAELDRHVEKIAHLPATSGGREQHDIFVTKLKNSLPLKKGDFRL